jgi:hypothetical protein
MRNIGPKTNKNDKIAKKYRRKRVKIRNFITLKELFFQVLQVSWKVIFTKKF